MKPCERRTGCEWEDTEHQPEEWISQDADAGGGRYTKDCIGTLQINGSLERAPGKYAANGYVILQLCLDHEGEPTYAKYGTAPANWDCHTTSNSARSLRKERPC